MIIFLRIVGFLCLCLCLVLVFVRWRSHVHWISAIYQEFIWWVVRLVNQGCNLIYFCLLILNNWSIVDDWFFSISYRIVRIVFEGEYDRVNRMWVFVGGWDCWSWGCRCWSSGRFYTFLFLFLYYYVMIIGFVFKLILILIRRVKIF